MVKVVMSTNAEFLLFVEDSPKPGGDGIGDIYLLHDVDGDGFIVMIGLII